jgi:hypothetical protein
MGAIATFSYPLFVNRYREFGGLDQSLAEAYFAEATLYLRNDGTGPVQDAGQQLALLNMLTAHIAALNQLNPDGSSASGLVGPITSASEGSVSVSSGLVVEAGTAGWYQQTSYGYAFWNATAAYRSMRYIPGRGAYHGLGWGYGGFGRAF